MARKAAKKINEKITGTSGIKIIKYKEEVAKRIEVENMRKQQGERIGEEKQNSSEREGARVKNVSTRRKEGKKLRSR